MFWRFCTIPDAFDHLSPRCDPEELLLDRGRILQKLAPVRNRPGGRQFVVTCTLQSHSMRSDVRTYRQIGRIRPFRREKLRAPLASTFETLRDRK